MFCGLDNSGKTSILLVLEKKFSLLTNLSPTKGIKRDQFEVLGHPIIKWDVGGQQKFRDAALKNDQLAATDLLFYVIDMQEPERIYESFQYLIEVINYFKNSGQKYPRLVVCFHKIDPDLVEDPQIQARVQENEKRLKEIIDFDYLTFQTTIYNNWTVRKAFSKGLLELSPKSTLLDSTMKGFLELTKSDTILLLDKDALIFGESYIDEENYQLSNIIAPHLATMADKMMKYGKEIEVFEGKIRGWICFKPIHPRKKKFYIVIFNKNIESFDEINFAIPELTEKIANILQAFFI